MVVDRPLVWEHIVVCDEAFDQKWDVQTEEVDFIHICNTSPTSPPLVKHSESWKHTVPLLFVSIKLRSRFSHRLNRRAFKHSRSTGTCMIHFLFSCISSALSLACTCTSKKGVNQPLLQGVPQLQDIPPLTVAIPPITRCTPLSCYKVHPILHSM